MISGFVNFYKPSGMTSSDAVAIVRGTLSRALGEKVKAGHMGTLDPFATGVLPIGVGKAARLFDILLKKQKTYIAVIKFGTATDTLDLTGKVLSEGGVVPSREDLERVLSEFTGELMQIPPAYSAKSVGGRRAYDLARKGQDVELAPVKVTVHSLRLLSFSGDEATAEICSGSGTYIRALARDIAARLGTTAHLTALERTASGAFTADGAVTREDFESDPAAHILPIDFPLADMPAVSLGETDALTASRGGRVILSHELPGGDLAVRAVDGRFIGIGCAEDGALRMKAVLC